MKKDYIIAKEGWSLITFAFLLTIISFFVSLYWLACVFLLIFLFTVYFFRDPERQFEFKENEIVAPADGKILTINKVFEDTYFKSEAIQIRIFLSILDVHINRIPATGIIEYNEKSGFKFYPANQVKAGDFNVKNSIGIKTDYGKVLVVQITGFIARRIVCYRSIGDKVEIGDKFGLIRFGSCTELYLPINSVIYAVPGQTIKGGETIIGEFNG